MSKLAPLSIVVGLGLVFLAHPSASSGDISRTRPVVPVAPVSDADFPPAPSSARFELGRALFFDKILSGNRNISCATCHHPSLATGDGLSLPLGEGARGLGPERQAGNDQATAVHGRVPRNSPSLFNAGAREFTRMFHDGRVEVDTDGGYESGFISPARWKLPAGLDSALAAQAMFPPTSPDEMAGQNGESKVGTAASLRRLAGPGGVWDLLAGRLRANEKYVELFRAAYPERVNSAADIDFVLAANAIAAFETVAFRSDQSLFDRYLRDPVAAPLPTAAARGMEIFYGRGGCDNCHSGKFQTDHEFHAIAMPQIGPGKADGSDPSYWQGTGEKGYVEDFGRGRVTMRPEDNYAFRTPSLRNVAVAGPWGHDGAYATLEAVIRHHVDPIASLESYDASQAVLPALERVLELTANGSTLQATWLTGSRLRGFLARDLWIHKNDALRGRIAAANELDRIPLSDSEIADLTAFLHSLTDPSAVVRLDLVPASVPSGLPVED